MKLHLTKSLRAALLACVCGSFAVTSQAMAESLAVGATETVSKTATEINAYDSVTVSGTLNLSASGDINSNQTINLSGGTLNLNNSWGTNNADTGDQGTVTVAGSGTISGSNVALYTTIDGTGDLTIQGGSSGFYVYGPISNDGDLTLGTNANIGGAWGYNSGANLTKVTSTGALNVTGDAVISSGATVDVGGAINIADAKTLTVNGGGVLVLDEAVSTTGNLTLNNATLDVSGLDLSTLSSTDTEGYSRGTSGFKGTTSTYSGLISVGTLSVTNSNVKVSETETVTLAADGSFSTFSHNGVFEVNDDLELKTAEMAEAAQILVAEGKTLTVKSGVCDDLNKNVTLAAGSTLNLENRSAMNNVQITLDGDAAISMYGTSMRGDVSGTGDLTLKQNTGNVAYIKGDINNTGKVTIEGNVQFQKDNGDIGTIGSNVDAVVVGTGNSLVLENAQTNSFDLELSDTGKVQVSNSSTLILGADSIVTGGTMTVSDANSVLDLSNVTTLTFDNLNLAAGSTIKLGEETRITFTDSLTIGEGVIFDLSSWCSYDEFTPYELFTYAGNAEGYSPNLPTSVTILTRDGLTNELAWLAYDVDTKKVTLIPEPTTATLSLLALAGLAARRRRK